MKILDIYSQYKIPPQLQEHQIRVAAVAKIICDHIANFSETKEVITTCLLHDMGNIIKFKLSLYPQFLEPLGYDYWKGVQDEFVAKYGPNEHEATYAIVKEIGVSPRVFELINAVGLSKAVENMQSSNLAQKICAYCDHRVAPMGIMSLEERMAEGKARHFANKNMVQSDDKQFAIIADAMRTIETQIFTQASIKPDYITDAIAMDVIETLRDFEL